MEQWIGVPVLGLIVLVVAIRARADAAKLVQVRHTWMELRFMFDQAMWQWEMDFQSKSNDPWQRERYKEILRDRRFRYEQECARNDQWYAEQVSRYTTS